MSGNGTGSQAPQPPSSYAAPRATRRLSFWIKELPFALALILTTLGVAYTSLTRQPLVGLLGAAGAVACAGLYRLRIAERQR